LVPADATLKIVGRLALVAVDDGNGCEGVSEMEERSARQPILHHAAVRRGVDSARLVIDGRVVIGTR
jgi:hypothetical protein